MPAAAGEAEGAPGVAVAVTGIGFGVAEDADPWADLVAGRSSLRPVRMEALGRTVLGASPRFDGGPYGSRAMMRTAVEAAMADAGGANDDRYADARCGWALGASKSDAADWTEPRGGPGWPCLGADGVAIPDGWAATGPRITPVAACATGVVAIIRGAELIQRGVCDRVVCGAADASLQPLILASFARLGVLIDRERDPAATVRPFDRNRCGFAVGEGAAAFVLERTDWAAPGSIYATVSGSSLLSSATKPTEVDAAGETVRRALFTATAGAAPDLIGLHGTATRMNDSAEAAGLRAAFPNGDRIPAFGSKGATGHLLGAAGAVELAFTLLALRDGIVPPTVHLRDKDPACGVNLSPVARRRSMRTAAKISLGFGGTVAAVALRRGDRPASPVD
ncbi:MAG: beta-ketoacyl synthase N-terminal-like domain-containing protein [Planctomycetota bacterium]